MNRAEMPLGGRVVHAAVDSFLSVNYHHLTYAHMCAGPIFSKTANIEGGAFNVALGGVFFGDEGIQRRGASLL